MLTSRLIQDPPYFKRRKLKETRIDYIGLGLVALGLGTLQVILDKGQREDWFESHFIVILSIISAVSLIFVIFWEWRHKDPIIDLHLFRDRTFAVSNLLMFMLGFALLGSTLLLPLFMQTLLGYSAEQAGLALMPGGFCIMLLLPLVGFLLSRYSPRWLLVFGLTVLSLSLFHMTGFDLQLDFRAAAMARIFQAVGMAFLFVPINTAAYAFLPRDKNNAASGLMNLGSQHRRKCRNFCGHDHARPARPGAPDFSRQSLKRQQSRAAGAAEGSGHADAVPRRRPTRIFRRSLCIHSGARAAPGGNARLR